MRSLTRSKRIRSGTVWIFALILTLASAVYQRMTGPTCPLRDSYQVDGEIRKVRLKRNPVTTESLKIAVPGVNGDRTFLNWREFPTSRNWKTVEMLHDGAVFNAEIPPQPPAGKIEYFIRMESRDNRTVTIPSGGKHAIARFKNPVPAWALIPHVILMFSAMLTSNRLGLGLLLGASTNPRLLWITFLTFTVGGMLLGPVVQYHAFGAAWTGWPVGNDLTDNKSAILWLCWMIPILRLIFKKDWRKYALIASLLTLIVYLIPHSLMGSEYRYEDPLNP